MADYSAGHIETPDAHALIQELQTALGGPRLRLYPGVSYRHLLVISGMKDALLSCTPPHDISGKPFAGLFVAKALMKYYPSWTGRGKRYPEAR